MLMGVLTPEATLFADRPAAAAPALRFGAMVRGMSVWMIVVELTKEIELWKVNRQSS